MPIRGAVHYSARMSVDAGDRSNTSDLARAIGSRIRRERLARHWTLDQLSESAGVSRRMLVNVEHGDANPSVGTLLKLSDALGIGLPSLVAPPGSNPIQVVRHGSGAVLWSGKFGGRGVLVAGSEPPNVVELWDWTLVPGDQHMSEAHSSGTKELALILQGSITLQVGDQSVSLATGDAVTFPGDVPHSYANPGTELARLSLVVFEPGVGSSPKSEVVNV